MSGVRSTLPMRKCSVSGWTSLLCSKGAPAQAATSASPEQSITTFGLTVTSPSLLARVTSVILPSAEVASQTKELNSTSSRPVCSLNSRSSRSLNSKVLGTVGLLAGDLLGVGGADPRLGQQFQGDAADHHAFGRDVGDAVEVGQADAGHDAARERRFLDEQGFRASPGSRQRRRAPGATATDHEHVGGDDLAFRLPVYGRRGAEREG
jgi:hypothetical protein